MKNFIIMTMILMSVLFTGTLNAVKIADLESVIKPNFIAVDGKRFYIVQGAEISVYLKDGLKKEVVFGKEGEGPKEFNIGRSKRGVFVYPQKENLIIHSIGKISIYSFKGEFIKTFNTGTGSRASRFKPMGNEYISMVLKTGGLKNSLGFYLGILDSDMKNRKELFKIPFIRRGRLQFPFIRPEFRALRNNIYIIDSKGDGVKVLNRDGKIINEIKPEYIERKITKEYENKIHNFFKTNPLTKRQYELIKKSITFSKYFPMIQNFWVFNRTIYMMSLIEKNGKSEFYVFDLKGKFIKKKYIDVSYVDPTRISPAAVYGNSFFQLKEGDENWELHKTDF